MFKVICCDQDEVEQTLHDMKGDGFVLSQIVPKTGIMALDISGAELPRQVRKITNQSDFNITSFLCIFEKR